VERSPKKSLWFRCDGLVVGWLCKLREHGKMRPGGCQPAYGLSLRTLVAWMWAASCCCRCNVHTVVMCNEDSYCVVGLMLRELLGTSSSLARLSVVHLRSCDEEGARVSSSLSG
jgi:hypothetical protein